MLSTLKGSSHIICLAFVKSNPTTLNGSHEFEHALRMPVSRDDGTTSMFMQSQETNNHNPPESFEYND